mmetsp:Transcript_73143/g.158715  ORF Transcript_73143/g.158715 Transcript_73143/m.158715 type:complete len:111 (-) Transcript_73143:453-785(-)
MNADIGHHPFHQPMKLTRPFPEDWTTHLLAPQMAPEPVLQAEIGRHPGALPHAEAPLDLCRPELEQPFGKRPGSCEPGGLFGQLGFGSLLVSLPEQRQKELKGPGPQKLV